MGPLTFSQQSLCIWKKQRGGGVLFSGVKVGTSRAFYIKRFHLYVPSVLKDTLKRFITRLLLMRPASRHQGPVATWKINICFCSILTSLNTQTDELISQV